MFSLKKLALALVLVMAASSMAYAHDYWVRGMAAKPGDKLTADVGFGHGFPEPEDLPEFFVKRMNPTKVIGAKGEVAVEPGKEGYRVMSKKGVEKGSYVVLGSTKPGVRTKTADGFESKYKNEVKGAEKCVESHMFAKNVVNVGGADLDFLKKPQGQMLEVIPQADPATIKPGQALPLLVLYDGKPLGRADVAATFGGFAAGDPNAKAFASKTGKDGIVNVVPLAAGFWRVDVKHEVPFEDTKMCDQKNFYSHFSFEIK